jgi:hypothetical protein
MPSRSSPVTRACIDRAHNASRDVRSWGSAFRTGPHRDGWRQWGHDWSAGWDVEQMGSPGRPAAAVVEPYLLGQLEGGDGECCSARATRSSRARMRS